jgi:hypothetical protein
MPTKYFATFIWLPPGFLPSAVTRDFFRRAFAEYQWFKPVHYGRANLTERLDPSHIDYDALVAYYEEYKSITVTARTDRDFFLLHSAKPDAPPHNGQLIWETSATEARKPSWRAAHLRQVSELMRMLNSPLAVAGLAEDYDRKTSRLVPHADGLGDELTFTVSNPSEGLAGLFWRNFYGPPFVRLFGERLATLPPDTRQALGDDLVLVQPYELPTQAGTPEAEARERELIAHLGPDCFYDHARHLKPTHLPDLTAAVVK